MLSSKPTDAISTPPITPGDDTAAIACINAKFTNNANGISTPKRYATAVVVVTNLMVEPHMWVFEHNGITKFAISSRTPLLSVHFVVTGITAADEQIEKPVR